MRDAAGLVIAARAELGMSRVAFGALTGRSAASIRRYEGGWCSPPPIFFHDLIDTAPECGLRFNDVAPVIGYRPVESADPARYASIHEFFRGVRVLCGQTRAGFAATLLVPPARIAAVEHRTKPRPYLVRRLAQRVLRPHFSYADVVRRFRTLRPSAADIGLRQMFRRLRDPRTSDVDRGRLRAQLIEEQADLARWLARREARRLVHPGEAADAWTLAVVKAVDGHDPRYGDFIPYLRRVVRFAVLAQARAGWQSGVAGAVRGQAVRVCRARDDLRQRLRREPTVAEVATDLGLPASTVADVLAALTARHAYPADSSTIESRAAAGTTAQTEGFSIGMRRRLARIDGHRRTVVEMLFLHDLDLAEIADRIGVDQQAVEAMLGAALLELRSSTASSGAP